jgi:hypothetical protein
MDVVSVNSSGINLSTYFTQVNLLNSVYFIKLLHVSAHWEHKRQESFSQVIREKFQHATKQIDWLIAELAWYQHHGEEIK